MMSVFVRSLRWFSLSYNVIHPRDCSVNTQKESPAQLGDERAVRSISSDMTFQASVSLLTVRLEVCPLMGVGRERPPGPAVCLPGMSTGDGVCQVLLCWVHRHVPCGALFSDSKSLDALLCPFTHFLFDRLFCLV